MVNLENKIIIIELEKEVKRNAYLLDFVDEKVLIDPGAKHHFELLIDQLHLHAELSEIDYVILQSNDFLNISSLELMVEKGFKGTVIANEAGLKYLKTTGLKNIETIADMDYKLTLKNGEELEFITTPFLPFPECFVTFFRKENMIFSGHMFSQDIHENENMEILVDAINSFHEMIMPSVEFVRHSLQIIRKLKISTIYPRLGFVIENFDKKSFFTEIMKYDFYNTKQVVYKKNAKNVSYNYEAICNHMLRWLTNRYDRQEVLEVFADSKITLEAYSGLEIENTELTGYKLWNYFFELIYSNKGVQWLALLEPVVRKYNKLYNINLPTIYRTKFLKQQQEIETLNIDNTQLEARVSSLQTKINETTDKLLRCPITNLYNQRFMVQHLLSNLDKPLSEGNRRALIVFQVDNLLSINKKYGVAKGDETLKNVVYLLNSLKREDTLLFKQNGPGIFVYIHEINKKDLWERTVAISNAIAESEVFVEPITLSISIVISEELNLNYSLEERVNQFIELALMRLERAKLKGKGEILNRDNDEKVYVEGIILLVDEDETNQNLMIKIFKRINYDCVIAKDIYQAYSILENHPIDVIVSEINLSKLDGFMLKQRINAEKTFEKIPFIITSHHKNLDVVMRANLLDVDLILQKPIIPEELIGHIKRIRDKRVRL